MIKPTVTFLCAIFALAGIALMAQPGAANAAECNELESRFSCERRDDCVYVPSYKTKKGTRVSSYCRSKGGSSTSGKKSKAKKVVKTKAKSKAKDKKKTKDTAKVKAKEKAKDKAKNKAKDTAKKKAKDKAKKKKKTKKKDKDK